MPDGTKKRPTQSVQSPNSREKGARYTHVERSSKKKKKMKIRNTHRKNIQYVIRWCYYNIYGTKLENITYHKCEQESNVEPTTFVTFACTTFSCSALNLINLPWRGPGCTCVYNDYTFPFYPCKWALFLSLIPLCLDSMIPGCWHVWQFILGSFVRFDGIMYIRIFNV